MAACCILAGILPQAVSKYLLEPAVSALLHVGNYVQAILGPGYAAEITGTPLPLPNLNYALAGYWRPEAWLVLFVLILAALTLASLIGGRSARPVKALPLTDDPKYDTFYSGEASEHSHVGGSDLFWGLRHNLKGYFNFLYSAHSGVVNDYALLIVSALAVIIVYMFIFVG
jgi:multicomponent Na+:H+ antiporter subunit D